ncbi:MAG: hypothetical protein KatS3mg057_0037 [Herpetosiphonaceae bacterium]|nr:MAG: hypothetical protein KatS3mg057_0037 [Herpetosiphonaceae bacterium]
MSNLSERLAALPPEKRQLLALRLKQKGIDISQEYILPASRSCSSFPLSFSQERLWFFDQLAPGSPVYNLPVALRISGDLRVDLLQRSIGEIVRRHEVLRHTFTTVDGQPVQVPGQPAPIVIPLIDLRGLPVDRRELLAMELAAASARRSFDLRSGPLIAFALVRLADDEHLLLLVVHHIVSDGWSSGIFIRELAAIYTALVEGRPSPLPDLPLQFIDYVVWQRERMQGQNLERELDFWKGYLNGAPMVLELPTDRPRPPAQTFRGSSASRLLSPELAEGLQALCKREGVTLFMALLAAFQALLARYTGQHDILVGSPVAGRSHREIEGLIGFFVNTIVLRTSLHGSPTVRELLARVRAATLEAFAHQDVPFETVVEAVQPERSLSHTPIFQVAFVLQNAPTQTLRLPGVNIEPLDINSGVAKFDLHLDVSETSAGLKATMEYSSDLFERATIERLLEHYARLLAGMVADEQQRMAEIALLSETERRQVLEGWNATQRAYPAQPVHALVAALAARQPAALAVQAGTEQVSYEALVAGAHRLAHLLRARGVRRGDRVGVYLTRSARLVEVLLGVLAAGAAYVPLDVSYPVERLALMAQDAGLALVLSERALAGQLAGLGVRVLVLEELAAALAAQPATAPAVALTLDDLAYVIYTSGSTGRPKGVAVPHRGIVRLIRDTNYISITPDDVIAQASNVSFDAATFEIWGALANGARLLIVPQETVLAPGELAALLARECVTTLFLTTALFNQIARLAPTAFNGLRHLLFGGEAVDPACVRQVLEHGGPERLLHVYGPTENTTYSTWYQVTAVPTTATTVPIGGPLANDRVYVLDEYMQPVPVGVPGELYVGGAGLAWGYLGRPALTAERFVPDPFGPTPGGRLYRTGDLVRWRAEGQLEFLGRIDQQVKLRGFRIELGEIEAVLRSDPSIEEAVVVVREDRPGDKRLVAYVTPAAGAQIHTGQLRDLLQRQLPAYMVPAAIVPLAALPINPNGKVDRRALPAPDMLAGDAAVEYEPPITPAEKILAEIWAEVLGVERVGRHDNFFALGGDSINAIQVANRATQAGVAISTKHIFLYQTIAELAQEAGTNTSPDGHRVVTGPVPLLPTAVRLAATAPDTTWRGYRALLLRSTESLDSDALQRALDALIAHHEALRLRLMRSDGQLNLEIAAHHAAPPLTLIELSGADQDDSSLTDQALNLSTRLNVEQGALLAAAVIRRAGAPDHLLLVIHELAADERSWPVIVEDLDRAYSQARRGESIQLPAPSADLPAWANAFHARLASLDAALEIERWRETLAAPVPLRPADSTGSSDSGQQSLVTALDATTASVVLQELPSIYHTRVDELITIALAWALHRWCGATTVTMALESTIDAGQLGLDGSRSVGCFSALYPVRLTLPAGSVVTALAPMKEQLRALALTGLNFDLGHTLGDELLRSTLAALPFPEVRLRCRTLPTAGKLLVPVQDLMIDTGTINPFTIDVLVTIRQDRLELNWRFNDSRYRPETIEQLALYCSEAIKQLVTNRQDAEGATYTPSDFPMAQLDSQKLNKLIANVSRSQRRSQQ